MNRSYVLVLVAFLLSISCTASHETGRLGQLAGYQAQIIIPEKNQGFYKQEPLSEFLNTLRRGLIERNPSLIGGIIEYPLSVPSLGLLVVSNQKMLEENFSKIFSDSVIFEVTNTKTIQVYEPRGHLSLVIGKISIGVGNFDDKGKTKTLMGSFGQNGK